VSVAVHAVNRAEPAKGDVAVVVGSGMIGLLVIQALRCAGVEQIVAIDREASRLALAREFGANLTVHTGHDDVLDAAMATTHGRGADVVFEVVGAAPTIDMSLRIVRRGGTVVLVGNLAPEVPFALQVAVTRELAVLGTCGSAGEYPASLALIHGGGIRVAPLISTVAPLSDGPEWFRRLSAPDGGRHLKVILQP
jgi:L-iditol 2-dehydrogenase